MEGVGELLTLFGRVLFSIVRSIPTQPLGAACIIAFLAAPWIEGNWYGMYLEAQNPTGTRQKVFETLENISIAIIFAAYFLLAASWHWPIIIGYLFIRRVLAVARGGFDWMEIVVDILEDASMVGALLLGINLLMGKGLNLPETIRTMWGKFGPFGPDWIQNFLVNIPNAILGSLMVIAAFCWPFIIIWRLRARRQLNVTTTEISLWESGDNLISTALLVFGYMALGIPWNLIALGYYVAWKWWYGRAISRPIGGFLAGWAQAQGQTAPGFAFTTQRLLLLILADMLVIGPLAIGASLILDPASAAGFASGLQEWWQTVSH